MTFGPEINGLISSINQFLGFVTLLEGGVGTVVLASLYKPIEETDEQRIKKILCSCQKFFLLLSLIFVVYTAVLSFSYPFFAKSSFNFDFIFALIWILSISIFTQYVFSITYRLFLHANQELFKVNFISACVIIVSFSISIVLIFLFPNIHILKLASSAVYLMTPIVYWIIVPKKYHVGFIESIRTKEKIKNRWDGFGQNLAHFINMNTDVIVITVFLSLYHVNVYSVYLMAIGALRSLFTNIASSYQSALGKDYASGKEDALRTHFKRFEAYSWCAAFTLFGTTLLLINQFVSLYTINTIDSPVDYYQPVFALIIVMANLVFCLREPYRILVFSTGFFRETNLGSILEATINILVSIILVPVIGLVGVAIGTLAAVLFRFVYYIVFLRKNILQLPLREVIVKIIIASFFIFTNIIAYLFIPLDITNIMSFIVYGFIITICEFILSSGVLFVSNKALKNLRAV